MSDQRGYRPGRDEQREPLPEEQEARESGGRFDREFGERARQQAGELKRQASSVSAEAADTARGVAERSKQGFSSRLDHLARALRAAGEALDEDQEKQLSGLSYEAADLFERFAGNLRDRDTGELFAELEDFAHRHPGLFLGGSALAGAATARFIQAASPGREEAYEPEPEHQSGRYGPVGETYPPGPGPYHATPFEGTEPEGARQAQGPPPRPSHAPLHEGPQPERRQASREAFEASTGETEEPERQNVSSLGKPGREEK